MAKTENDPIQEEEVLKEQQSAEEEAAEESTETTENTEDSEEDKEEKEEKEQQEEEQQEEEQTEENETEKKLAEALEEIEKQKDKYLRLSAEFDNYRKRTLKEKAELIKNGAEKTISAILPVLDDFERALQNMDNSEELKAMREGVELIYNKSLNVLSKEGLQKIETEGKDFDVDFCEAIAMVPAPSEDKKGKILDCVQTGYMLHDKVIRHAKVVVAQ